MRAALLALSIVMAGAVNAQTGHVIGTVQNASGQPIAGANIFVATLALSVRSRDNGTFTIPNVLAGSYELKVFRIGFAPSTLPIVVSSGDASRVTVRLEPTAIVLDAVVASVSRRPESITDAPAAVTHFGAAAVQSVLGSPVTNLLKQAPGIDLTQVGVMSSFLNGRGFNRTFNSRWLTVEDGRVAVFPETGLPIGEHTTIIKSDIADVEVIAGPGSALYGANASGGVLSVTTKDPRQFPGTTLELSGGAQDYRDIQARYAGSRGKWGYKLTAQHQTAREWLDTVHYATVPPGNPALLEGQRDPVTRATRVSGSLRYYLDDDNSQIALNTGTSVRDALGHSANGRYQIDGYRYSDFQLSFRNAHWFAQAYATHSNSGNTYRMSTLTFAEAAAPALSFDSARTIAAFPVDGRIQALEVQNNETIGSLVRTGVSAIDNSRVTWGLQVRHDRVWSDRRLYTDVLTGRPIHFDQRAFYAQIESPPMASFRIVGAARFDTHNRFPSRWSPKIGVLFNVARDRVLRLTFNGAYLAPSIFQSDLYLVNTAARFASIGGTDGFDIRDASGALVSTTSQIRPETNQTWELGFKGKLGARMYVDATGYHAQFRDFFSQVSLTADPFAASPTFAYNHRTGQRVEDANGNPLRLLTPLNVGEGDFVGLDVALRYYVSDRISLSSATSLSHIIAIRAKPTDPKDATAFNSSAHRSSVSVDYTDAPRKLSAGLRTRYVHGYEFRSATDWGRIPSFGTVGLSASYHIASLNTTLLLQADNVLSCVGGTSTPPALGISATTQATYTAHRSCGLGVRHHEILNMPAVGTTVFAGVRREWR